MFRNAIVYHNRRVSALAAVLLDNSVHSGIYKQFINRYLLVPMAFLVKNNIVAKVINVCPLLFFGYSSVRLPWEFNMSYGVLQYIIGISLTIIILTSFVVMMIAPFWIEEINE